MGAQKHLGMILSEKAIKEEIRLGRLKISPQPDENIGYDADCINVHMGNKLYRWKDLGDGQTLGIQLGLASYKDIEQSQMIL